LHCFKRDGQHHLGFELFAERIRLPGRDKNPVLQRYTQQYATALEAQLIQAPLQWFNFFDFWGDSASTRNQTPG
jgi:predicted LPLAT superfamily acyltransferase